MKNKYFQIDKILKKLYPKIETSLNYQAPFQLLVAVILSAQTTDKKVNEITPGLFKKYKTVADFAQAKQKDMADAVYGVNYRNQKAISLIESAKMIQKEFKGRVPRTMEQMLKLRGVARKTANVVLSNAHGEYVGIAVDTHVIRLSQMLGLTKEKDPRKIEVDLMEIVPKGREWRDFSLRLIQYGRDYCPARKHPHTHCPLSKYYSNA